MCEIISTIIGVIFGAAISYLSITCIEKKRYKVIECKHKQDFFDEVAEWKERIPGIAKKASEALKSIDTNTLWLGPYIDFITIDKMFAISLSGISNEQRKAIRTIKYLCPSINEKVKDIFDHYRFDNTSKYEDVLKVMIRELASLYYILIELDTKKDRFHYPDKSNEEMSDEGLKSLKIDSDPIKNKH